MEAKIKDPELMASQGYMVKATFEPISKTKAKVVTLLLTGQHVCVLESEVSTKHGNTCLYFQDREAEAEARLVHEFKASLVHLARPAVSEKGGGAWRHRLIGTAVQRLPILKKAIGLIPGTNRTMVTFVCKTSIQEVEVRGSEVQGQPGI